MGLDKEAGRIVPVGWECGEEPDCRVSPPRQGIVGRGSPGGQVKASKGGTGGAEEEFVIDASSSQRQANQISLGIPIITP